MNKNTIDLLLKIGMVIFCLAVWSFIGYAILNPHQASQDAIEQEIIPRTDSYCLIEQNSLKAITNPITIKPQVLGMMMGGMTHQQAELLNELWQCEARLKHEGIWGDNGKAYGAFQFWQSTWNSYCEGSRDDFEDQLKCAAYIIFELGEGKIHWVKCWRNLNLDKYF